MEEVHLLHQHLSIQAGGGGATAVGQNAQPTVGGYGGAGATTSISGSAVAGAGGFGAGGGQVMDLMLVVLVDQAVVEQEGLVDKSSYS